MNKTKNFKDIIANPLFELLHLQPEEAMQIAQGSGTAAAIAHSTSCEFCGWLVSEAKEFLAGATETSIPASTMVEVLRTILGREPTALEEYLPKPGPTLWEKISTGLQQILSIPNWSVDPETQNLKWCETLSAFGPGTTLAGAPVLGQPDIEYSKSLSTLLSDLGLTGDFAELRLVLAVGTVTTLTASLEPRSGVQAADGSIELEITIKDPSSGKPVARLQLRPGVANGASTSVRLPCEPANLQPIVEVVVREAPNQQEIDDEF